MMMDKDRRLFVYGTLAPGEENAHVLAHCRGDWMRGSVTGRLVDTGWGAAMGFPALQIDPTGETERVGCYTQMICRQAGPRWTSLRVSPIGAR